MDIGSIGNMTRTYHYAGRICNRQIFSSMFQSALSDIVSNDKTGTENRSFEEMWKSRYPGAKYHVMDTSDILQGTWERNDFPYERFFDDEVNESVMSWRPSGKEPKMSDASVQSRLDSTLGKKAIVVPPELEEKMKNDPELAEKVMGKVEHFIHNHPTRPGRILSYLIALDENGEIAHFRVTGGGGHISGPSESDLRKFEEEQETKREKRVQQEKKNKEYNLRVAEERKRLQEEIYRKQSAEVVLKEHIVSNTKMFGIMTAYEAGTIAGNRL